MPAAWTGKCRTRGLREKKASLDLVFVVHAAREAKTCLQDCEQGMPFKFKALPCVTTHVPHHAFVEPGAPPPPLPRPSGIRTWVANPLQLSPHPHPSTSTPATAPQPPYPSFDDPLPPPTPSSTTTLAPGTPPPPAPRPTPTPSLGPATAWRSIRDDGRSLQLPPSLQYPGAGPGSGPGSAGGAGGGGPPWSGPCLCPAPRGCLVAAVDCLGRVLLVEAVGGALQVTRMWKVRERGGEGGGGQGTGPAGAHGKMARECGVHAGRGVAARIGVHVLRRGGPWDA